MEISAKRLILGLLLASSARSLSASQLIGACALFGITGNSVRVTLTRLSSEGKIESAGRGSYRLGRSARRLGDEVGSWRRSETRLSEWRGDFLAAFTANLGRRNRADLRRRERALEMLGFRELERGLHVRPNNLREGVEGARARLLVLGMDADCSVFCATDFAEDTKRRIETLWDGARLSRHYTEERSELEAWMRRHHELEPDVAARESYLLGSAAIRSIVFDPWLPAPFVDIEARHEFFETVCRFDDLGKSIWSAFTAQVSALPVSEPEIAETRH